MTAAALVASVEGRQLDEGRRLLDVAPRDDHGVAISGSISFLMGSAANCAGRAGVVVVRHLLRLSAMPRYPSVLLVGLIFGLVIAACSSSTDSGLGHTGGAAHGGAGGAASGGAGGAASGGAGGASSGGAGGAASGGAGGASSGGAGGASSGGAGIGGLTDGGGAGGGGTSGGSGTGRDGGQESDGPPAGFCTGGTPRMVVNGITTTPTVVGQQLVLDCCEGGRFVVTASDFVQPVAVEWREQAGASAPLPASVDLDNLPAHWSVSLYAGCSVSSAGCLGALDNFTTGFAGSLSASYADGGFGLDMSLCMHFEEPAGTPGTYLHTLDLYAPHVSTHN